MIISSPSAQAFQQARKQARNPLPQNRVVASRQIEHVQAVQPLSPKTSTRRKMKRAASPVVLASPIKRSPKMTERRERLSSSSKRKRAGDDSSLDEMSASSDADISEELKRLVAGSSSAAPSSSSSPVTTEKETENRQVQQSKKPSIPAFRSGIPKATYSNKYSTTAFKDPVISPIDRTTQSPSQTQRRKTLDEMKDTRSSSEQDVDKQLRERQGKNSNVNAKDIQRYYRTDLLTVEEEYILGSQIQLMIACEEVHEGLSIRLGRLPTFGEWAAACGYSTPEEDFHFTEADEQLRPAGSSEMFEDVDPSLFVGNGQIGESGPGRGRGRAKKIPGARLKDMRTDRFSPPSQRERNKTPFNRGSVRDFLEMISEGREAKQAMVQSNMRLVVSIARKYVNVGVSLHDLVQEGSLGLSRAAEKFEPRKGFKFSTYASWWIQQAVFRAIAYHSRTIRLPVHIHNMLNRIHRVKNTLTKELGRSPSNEEMASNLGMSLQKYNKLLRLTKRSISLDLPKYKSNPKDLGHESDALLSETIDASSVNTAFLDDSAPEKLVDHTLFLDDLKSMLRILDKEERMVLCARYGLSDGITRTVTAVAAQMNESKAWVRSQECRALRKLRRPWYEKKLKEHERSLSS